MVCNGDASSSLLLNFALEYAIRKVQENLNETHQLRNYADDDGLFIENPHTIKKNTDFIS
jgi:hypothetical protein